MNKYQIFFKYEGNVRDTIDSIMSRLCHQYTIFLSEIYNNDLISFIIYCSDEDLNYLKLALNIFKIRDVDNNYKII